MRVAVPIHNGRVSPTFDWAMHMLVVDLSGDAEVRSPETSLSGMSPPKRVERVKALGVDVLICGGISNALLTLAESLGVRVVPWVSGAVDDVLRAFAQGQLAQNRFAMPGCRGRARPGGCDRRQLRRHRMRRGRSRGNGGES
jgi:predicted Fe-Mo cluster-binding NifX family protein